MKTRKLHDVSLTIYPGMLVWTGNPPVLKDYVKSIAQGASSNVSLLQIGSHSGTHVDAPRHFIEGAPGIDATDPQLLVGKARLVRLTEAHHIDRKTLAQFDLKGVSRLLLATPNSKLIQKGQFTTDYAFITEDAARYIVEMGVKVVGIDWLSIEEYQKPGHPAHHILLGAGVVIIEGLELSAIPPGDYELLCFPLKIKDGDGAPARVFLREL